MSARPPRRWFVLRLEAPLVAFGGVTIDHLGFIRDFPALSMLTGLFANALGWDRTQTALHQALQDRLIFAARRESEPYVGALRDMQNVQDLDLQKRGWTTRGKPEERGGGSLGETHRRQRDYHPDSLTAVVVTLADPTANPTLDDLAHALDHPARPLFIGRKPCLPSGPLRYRLPDGTSFIEAETAHDALVRLPRMAYLDDQVADRRPNVTANLRALWPMAEGPTSGPNVERSVALADRRNWISGLHGGTRNVVEGRIVPAPSERQP